VSENFSVGTFPQSGFWLARPLRSSAPLVNGSPAQTKNYQKGKRTMKNTIPRQLDQLFSLAEVMADGCNAHAAAIGILQNTEIKIRNDLAAARTAENIFQAARVAKLTAVGEQTTADQQANAFILVARDVLKPHFGNTWSQMWVEAGFVSGTLAAPDSLGERLELLMTLKAFFTTHQNYEADQVGVTATTADDRHQVLSTARSTVNACRADVGTKKDARNAAANVLRKRMRGLITELEQLVSGDDARWRAFGLNPPNAVGIPEVPEGLLVTGGASGHLLGTWDSAPLAQRYHVYRKIVGVDAEFVFAKTVTETEADMNTFTPGQLVRVRVTAVNDAGESLPSDSVEQTVP
jgi:hypothetical protein